MRHAERLDRILDRRRTVKAVVKRSFALLGRQEIVELLVEAKLGVPLARFERSPVIVVRSTNAIMARVGDEDVLEARLRLVRRWRAATARVLPSRSYSPAVLRQSQAGLVGTLVSTGTRTPGARHRRPVDHACYARDRVDPYLGKSLRSTRSRHTISQCKVRNTMSVQPVTLPSHLSTTISATCSSSRTSAS